jgi:hypothetical protein
MNYLIWLDSFSKVNLFVCLFFPLIYFSYFIEKQGSKAIRLKYADNVRLIALSKQATIGKWDASYTKNVGLLDVVGNDRKYGKSINDNKKKHYLFFLILDKHGVH